MWAQIVEGVTTLGNGGVVAYPTDTLYGLGADPFNLCAIERVFVIKGRPLGMPLPLLLAEIDVLPLVSDRIPVVAWRLAERFWPGALTLVLPKAPNVPSLVTARGWTVGVRVPDHPVPRALAEGIGGALIGTSANRSGGLALRTASEVRGQLGLAVDMVVDVGPQPAGRESTVLDLTGSVPKILRQGVISREDLETYTGISLG